MKLQIVGNCPDCGAPVYGAKSCEGKEKKSGMSDLVRRETIKVKYVPEWPTYPVMPAPNPWYECPTRPTWDGRPYTTCASDTIVMGPGGHDCIRERQQGHKCI